MEVIFREAGNFSQLRQFHLAMQILAEMVDDPINSLGIFAVALDVLTGHGFYRHGGVEYPTCVAD